MDDLFEKLKMDKSLAEALRKQGITTLTDVQDIVIPLAVENKDLVVQSETGTGKTLSYLLPLFNKIDHSKKEMQAMIIAPTHELVMQIIKQIEKLSQNSEIKITSTPIIGNVNIERQIDKLKEKPHIIAGTPGRILELTKRRKIAAHTIKTIIIDETDILLNENNIDMVKEIIKSTLRDRQLMMFSATVNKRTETVAKELMKDPGIIRVTGKASIPETIVHHYFLTQERDKLEVLRKIIRIINPGKALIFIGDREDADFCKSRLAFHGIITSSLHGHVDKKDRKATMENFISGRSTILIASDIAARGLDIEGITHIFNLNIPEHSGDYLHRAGRCGRAGNSGTVVSIVTEHELNNIGLFETELKIEIKPKAMFQGKIVDVKRNHINDI
ncbi:MAG: DEAD/DEAH box helicase [Saccharofermentanales bacterium]